MANYLVPERWKFEMYVLPVQNRQKHSKPQELQQDQFYDQKNH